MIEYMNLYNIEYDNLKIKRKLYDKLKDLVNLDG
jgi:hypothetical protein